MKSPVPGAPMAEFANEPIRELRRAPERSRLEEALVALDRRLPIAVPVMIGPDARDEPDFDSVDPSDPGRVVARATSASPREVEAAVRVAAEAQRDWGARPASERAAVMSRAAAELRERRAELAALAARECAKPWSQADADVCEAIDFLEFYAREVLALDASSQLIQMPGERNTLRHRARGVVAVIAPWNFPFAILTGMTAAGLVTGNAVCVKPAEQSPACGLAVVEALRRAGVPDGVLALLPGDGTVGGSLVDDPSVQTIAFTGSSAVGLEILRKAATPAPGQRHLKRVIAEMGGKNCVIVDADADLDEVIPALLDSAYAFAGQKCSAASRTLVHERIADELLERMRGALQTLRVGPPEDFETDVPPVIDADARDRIESALAELGPEAEIDRAALPAGSGYWVAPTIVAGAPADSTVVTSELFGPVLTIEPVAGVDAACDIVDGLGHALTGGLFSRDPATIERVIARSPVGNFYVNRATTGAMPGRQPFGGNRLSGMGFKAGGGEYLPQFVDSHVVTENTVRHGLPIE
ncbi:MAG: aldehyde dehydrogenase family protein [Solirubrobacterales bacterium]